MSRNLGFIIFTINGAKTMFKLKNGFVLPKTMTKQEAMTVYFALQALYLENQSAAIALLMQCQDENPVFSKEIAEILCRHKLIEVNKNNQIFIPMGVAEITLAAGSEEGSKDLFTYPFENEWKPLEQTWRPVTVNAEEVKERSEYDEDCSSYSDLSRIHQNSSQMLAEQFQGLDEHFSDVLNLGNQQNNSLRERNDQFSFMGFGGLSNWSASEYSYEELETKEMDAFVLPKGKLQRQQS